jgi:hypothetical protein
MQYLDYRKKRRDLLIGFAALILITTLAVSGFLFTKTVFLEISKKDPAFMVLPVERYHVAGTDRYQYVVKWISSFGTVEEMSFYTEDSALEFLDLLQGEKKAGR